MLKRHTIVNTIVHTIVNCRFIGFIVSKSSHNDRNIGLLLNLWIPYIHQQQSISSPNILSPNKMVFVNFDVQVSRFFWKNGLFRSSWMSAWPVRWTNLGHVPEHWPKSKYSSPFWIIGLVKIFIWLALTLAPLATTFLIS